MPLVLVSGKSSFRAIGKVSSTYFDQGKTVSKMDIESSIAMGQNIHFMLSAI